MVTHLNVAEALLSSSTHTHSTSGMAYRWPHYMGHGTRKEPLISSQMWWVDFFCWHEPGWPHKQVGLSKNWDTRYGRIKCRVCQGCVHLAFSSQVTNNWDYKTQSKVIWGGNFRQQWCSCAKCPRGQPIHHGSPKVGNGYLGLWSVMLY
jgi:hypothetical protein